MDWDGIDRRQHNCIQEETIGKFKEFMQNTKGFKSTLFTVAFAIIIQAGTFLYLWGGITGTVSKNTLYLWEKLTPIVYENTRNIDRILTKMESIQIIAVTKAPAHGNQNKL